jgi:hypothetical protein
MFDDKSKIMKINLQYNKWLWNMLPYAIRNSWNKIKWIGIITEFLDFCFNSFNRLIKIEIRLNYQVYVEKYLIINKN